ncbi:ABC transporter ATP-binding protein [Streptomyces antibioticus]|uniref:ABC transporter ATP-binding protein n=1 Tax=Streptomyces antibioticus TaxID=1890 RepID=UPI0033AF711F
MNLEIKEFAASFNGRRVAYVPELTLSSNEIVGIVGESGSGKSMTAMALLGLAGRLGAHVTGSIRLDGVELVGADDPVLREIRGCRIAPILQTPSTAFNPVLRVGKLFTRTLALHGVKSRSLQQERTEAALASVLLPSTVLRRYPHQMSGGQLQRVSIALALALQAELLLADEPTSALDVTIQAEILDLIAKLREEQGLAVLMISHDIGALARIADRLVVMKAGRVVETGPTSAVITSPTHAYTRELIDAIPGLVDLDNDTSEDADAAHT